MTDVLVLDDNPNVLRIVARSLASTGADVVACREIEGAEALLDHKRFDTVVADLNVSERGGLEGMRLIRHVKAHYPDTCVLGISGMVDERIDGLGRAMGARAILEKPLDFARLRQLAVGDAATTGKVGRVTDLEPLEAVLTSGRVRSALQPICSLGGTSERHGVMGVEALARVLGDTPLTNPAVLFEYAVRKDKVLETDRRCIGAALQEAQQLPDGLVLFINAHPESLSHPSFGAMALEMVRQAGFEPAHVVFEVTEQRAIDDPASFARTLVGLREAGFRIALDDFGSGFANLHLLRELSPEYVKLSGVFVRGIDSDPTRQLMVAGIVKIVEQLGAPLIAECIETEGELEAIRKAGIAYGQGYWFARPAPAAHLLTQEDRIRFGG